jgi:hypothetical protein
MISRFAAPRECGKPTALRDFEQPEGRYGSKARITAPQHCCPLHPNQRTSARVAPDIGLRRSSPLARGRLVPITSILGTNSACLGSFRRPQQTRDPRQPLSCCQRRPSIGIVSRTGSVQSGIGVGVLRNRVSSLTFRAVNFHSIPLPEN